MGGDDERVSRIETARDSNDHFRHTRTLQAFHQTLHLDVVGLIAAPVAQFRD